VFGVRITNYSSSAVALANVNIVVWLYESGTEDMDRFANSTGQTCASGGGSCNSVQLTNTSTSHGTYATCTSISGHFANQAVTFTIGASDTVVIPANGGYWQSQADMFHFGRNNPSMDNNNWADDYSHLGTGTGCPDSNLHDSPYYVLYYNGQLVPEVLDSSGTADPNTGKLPCSP
jgi:hypothetical protein